MNREINNRSTQMNESRTRRNENDEELGGISRWVANIVFGRADAESTRALPPPAQDASQNHSPDVPAVHAQDDRPFSAPPPQRPFVLAQPFQPPTAVRLPPLPDSEPPLPPPRQRRPVSVAPAQPVMMSNIQPLDQRPLRVSGASTLVDEDNGSETSRMHYGPAPDRTARRYATHRVRLTNGNLVVNQPVPERLFNAVPYRDQEFTTMRYTAATCSPDEFPYQGYTLRPQIYGRETELFIVITMYNEDEILFARTMHSVMKNIAHLCGMQNHPVWGPKSWQKVVVAIVADGRKIINERVLKILTCMGVYQAGVAKNMVQDKPVTAHIYEFTTQMSINEDMQVKGMDKAIPPVQILFCLKEKNAKKINSHRWFFNAFGQLLKPNVCVLLDVGTRPGSVSIYDLWKTFDKHPHVGGACGEIRAMPGPFGQYLLNPLVAAQNFEYKMSNILDKPMESVFGYISVLPGAFSAYRYKAIQNDVNGQGPLEKYFKGEALHAANDGGLFEANMYLAEDRILCFELVAKKNERWLLHYCHNAYAETDVPDALAEFISQRRRWLNGSFFAGVYSLWHFSSVWRSNHSVTRMTLLAIQTAYSIISLIFSWFALGNFYITFFFITKSLSSSTIDPFGNGWGTRIFDVARYVYLFVLVVVFICSMGNRPQGSQWLFRACLLVFSIIMCYMLFASSWLIYKGVELAKEQITWTDSTGANIRLALENTGLRNMVVSLLATYGLYFVSSLMYRDPWHMITSFIPYLILLPGYVNILNIYAFCNTHDVSWGTKGDNDVSRDLGVAKKNVSATGEVVETVDMILPAGQKDIERQYEEAFNDLKCKPPSRQPPPARNQEDYFRSFRTHLVLVWTACNVLLVALVTSTEFDAIYIESVGTSYMTFVLWANAGLAAFRFLGSILYLILSLFSAL